MQNVGLGIPALAHVRRSKRARYERQGVNLPEIDLDLGRTQQVVELHPDATTPAQQVRHRNKHRKDALSCTVGTGSHKKEAAHQMACLMSQVC